VPFVPSKKNEWELPRTESKFGKLQETAVPMATLKDIGTRLSTLPSKDVFNFHDQIQKIYSARLLSIQSGQDLDFATTESLAFGSLLLENYAVRLSGQDVQRGTFSHRHAVLHDQKEDKPCYVPLDLLLTKQ